MEKLKQYSAFIVLVLLVLGLAFWWYEWRPSRLIRACQLWSIDRAQSISGDREDALYFFEKCLRENGIDK